MGRQPWDGKAAALVGQMNIQWTSKASSDLVRLHEHLSPVAPEAAARVSSSSPAHRIGCPIIRGSARSWKPMSRARPAGSSSAITRCATRSRPEPSSCCASRIAARTATSNRRSSGAGPGERGRRCGARRQSRLHIASGEERRGVPYFGHSQVTGLRPDSEDAIDHPRRRIYPQIGPKS